MSNLQLIEAFSQIIEAQARIILEQYKALKQLGAACMEEEIDLNALLGLLGFAAGILTGLWGWMGWLVIGWVVCMLLDWISGSMAAAKDGNWDSATARAGIWHKAGMVIVVMVTAIADLVLSVVLSQLPISFKYPGMICPIVLVWYIVSELGSITENALAMGAPVPEWLTRLLKASRDAVDKAGDDICDGD